MRLLHRCHGLRWSGHLDSRRSLAPEDIEEQLARRTGDPNHGFARPNRHLLVGAHTLDLQADLTQPAAQVTAPSANVAP